MLKLINVTKDYKMADTTVKALRGISLQFRANEFVSILGASGCGKTTLLNIIGGLDHYTSGDLIIRGKSTKAFKDADWDVYRNHRIGFIFQSYHLISHQTVLANVEMALTIAGVSSEERRRRAIEALDRVGLKDQLKKRPNQLSGGQMQRVAIARALVNNPEILLADEPTGALDSETSVQIMELIKEISREKLVIMVTHNPELAEQYSTRIVRLHDGEVVSDSNPYESKAVYKEEKGKKKKKEKASMSLFSSAKLSFKNLMSKGGRTFMTSFAGSIGIIGVSMVLALSSGINGYIDDMQHDMLSAYPIEIQETALNIDGILENGESLNPTDVKKLSDKVYVNSMLTSMAKGMSVTNDLSEEYISYVQAMPSEYYYDMLEGYGNDVSMNIYTKFDSGEDVSVMSMSAIYSMYSVLLATVNDGEFANLTALLSMVGNGTAELIDNKDYVLSQYDLIGAYPEKENEIAIVVNGSGELSDITLAQLGYLTQEEFFDYAEDRDNAKEYFSINEILNKEYTYYPNDEIYEIGDNAIKYSACKDSLNESGAVKLTVTGVLQIKEGINYGSLSTGMYYTRAFTERYLNDNLNSEIVNYAKEQVTRSVSVNATVTIAGDKMTFPYAYTKDRSVRQLGGNDLAISVAIYAVDFDNKDLITEYLDKWNEDNPENEVVYTDTLKILISMVKTMMNIVTYGLIAFTAISLVVSSVMIGVVTFVSVVERTKEIGILRALGARKKDIKHLFNAETFIIGAFAGGIGVGVTYLLSVPINLILKNLTGIATIASLPLTSAVVMIVISIVLTLISGLIPASAAAKKDPVIALRTE